MASVLYPYVYLTTRIVFLMQGRNIADVARTLGASPSKVFWRVLLPVARPAIVAGVALVLMETINDIGAANISACGRSPCRSTRPGSTAAAWKAARQSPW